MDETGQEEMRPESGNSDNGSEEGGFVQITQEDADMAARSWEQQPSASDLAAAEDDLDLYGDGGDEDGDVPGGEEEKPLSPPPSPVSPTAQPSSSAATEGQLIDLLSGEGDNFQSPSADDEDKLLVAGPPEQLPSTNDFNLVDILDSNVAPSSDDASGGFTDPFFSSPPETSGPPESGAVGASDSGFGGIDPFLTTDTTQQTAAISDPLTVDEEPPSPEREPTPPPVPPRDPTPPPPRDPTPPPPPPPKDPTPPPPPPKDPAPTFTEAPPTQEVSGSRGVEEITPTPSATTTTSSTTVKVHKPKPSGYLSFLKSLNPVVLYIMYWRDMKLSAVVLGVCLVVLLTLTLNTLLHTFVLLLLSFMVVSLTYIISKVVIDSFYNKKVKNPFHSYLEKEIKLPEDELLELFIYLMKKTEAEMNCLVRLLLFANIKHSLLFGVGLWMVSFVTNYFTLLYAMFFLVGVAFSVPWIYSKFQSQIDTQLDLVTCKLRSVTRRVMSYVPLGGGKKKSE